MNILEFDSCTFGSDLRRLREEKDLTQEQLAKKAGVHLQTLYNYEQGFRLPKLDILLDIALVLGVDEIRISTKKGGGRYGT